MIIAESKGIAITTTDRDRPADRRLLLWGGKWIGIHEGVRQSTQKCFLRIEIGITTFTWLAILPVCITNKDNVITTTGSLWLHAFIRAPGKPLFSSKKSPSLLHDRAVILAIGFYIK
ncbi:hypothetical protein D3C78_504030 [compost metagenome]